MNIDFTRFLDIIKHIEKRREFINIFSNALKGDSQGIDKRVKKVADASCKTKDPSLLNNLNEEISREISHNNYDEFLMESDLFYIDILDILILMDHYNIPLLIMRKQLFVKYPEQNNIKELGTQNYALTNKNDDVSKYSILLINSSSKANTPLSFDLVVNNKEPNQTIKFELNDLPPPIREIIDRCKSSTVTYNNADDEKVEEYIKKNIDPCDNLDPEKTMFNVVRKFLEKKYEKKE